MYNVCVSVWSEDSYEELVLSFHHVGPRIPISCQVWWQTPLLVELSHQPLDFILELVLQYFNHEKFTLYPEVYRESVLQYMWPL